MPTTELKISPDLIGHTETLLYRLCHSDEAEALDKVIDAIYLALSMINFGTDCVSQASEASGNQLYKDFISGNKHPEDILMTVGLIVFMLTVGLACSKAFGHKKMQALWPFFRNILSGLKNGRHAFMNVYFLMSHLGHVGAYHMFNPIGIAVGAALAPILIAYRKLDNNRTKMISENQEIIKAIAAGTYDGADAQTHGVATNRMMIGFAAVDGLTDGSYMFGCLMLILHGISFLGVAGLSTVTGGAPIIAYAVALSVYSVLSMVCKIDDEIKRQEALKRSADEAKIAISEYKNSTNKESIKKSIEIEKDAFSKKYGIPYGETAARAELDKKFNDFEAKANTLYMKLPLESAKNLFVAYMKVCKKIQAIDKETDSFEPHKKRDKLRGEKSNLYDQLKRKLSTIGTSIPYPGLWGVEHAFETLRIRQSNHVKKFTPPQKNYSGILKTGAYIWRGLITGKKNIDRIGSAVGGTCVTILKIPVAALYAAFLGQRQHEKHIPRSASSPTLFAKPKDAIATNQRWRAPTPT